MTGGSGQDTKLANGDSRGPGSVAGRGRRARRPAAPPQARRRWLRLSYLLFFSLLLSGIIPLGIGIFKVISSAKNQMIEHEREALLESASSWSRELDGYLTSFEGKLAQEGASLLAFPGPPTAQELLLEPWIEEQIRSFQKTHPEVLSFSLVDARTGQGPGLGMSSLGEAAARSRSEAFEEALREHRTAFRVAAEPGSAEPLLIAAVPVGAGERLMVVSGTEKIGVLAAVSAVDSAAGGEAVGSSVLLADANGDILWADPRAARLRPALEKEGGLPALGPGTGHLTLSFEAEEGGQKRSIQLTAGTIPRAGWQVAVMRDSEALFAAVNRMILSAIPPSVVLVLLALGFAVFMARFIGKPLAQMAETTHQIAAGDFSHRLPPNDLSVEMAQLAENFNVMTGHVERYVEELKLAASANRELFLGAIRAFAAAIDAKDPYTRGHSERVAAVSRAVSRHLGYDEDFQQRVWLAALLHDVGKIGVDDRILKKGGLLSPEEYEQMKMHTVIGAEIIGRIEPLKELVPAIRWHHESWNGRGYPDALKGEQIPLIARIVSVADTFDAVTTNRPYQQAYTPEFAVNTITKLAGNRFDAKVVTAFLSAFSAGHVDSAIQRNSVAVEPS
ncbi:MAG: HD-GYP domain-containing protein [Thermoanaerobaculia bacterium]